MRYSAIHLALKLAFRSSLLLPGLGIATPVGYGQQQLISEVAFPLDSLLLQYRFSPVPKDAAARGIPSDKRQLEKIEVLDHASQQCVQVLLPSESLAFSPNEQERFIQETDVFRDNLPLKLQWMRKGGLWAGGR